MALLRQHAYMSDVWLLLNAILVLFSMAMRRQDVFLIRSGHVIVQFVSEKESGSDDDVVTMHATTS